MFDLARDKARTRPNPYITDFYSVIYLAFGDIVNFFDILHVTGSMGRNERRGQLSFSG